MAFELLYQTDAYLREFDATVVAVEDDAVVLDRTAFYPGGGGQPCDRGTLTVAGQVVTVTEVTRKGGQVLHRVSGGSPPVGTNVRGVLDWDHRHKLMRTHTALHILCGVVFRDYGALVTGGNMKPLEARMDFELAEMSGAFSQEVEATVNREIAAARPIRVRILPRAEAFQIPDLIRTKINLLPPEISEVGRVRVVGHESKGKINKRLRIAIE